MPLQDHFNPPLSLHRHWHAFHNSWATYIASHLNQQLPAGYFAEANVQFGIEIDVAAFEELGGQKGAPALWTPPEPTQTIPISIQTDWVEVAVYNREGGPTLAGAVEVVSPANKDRPAHREAFVTKCASYIQDGIGLVIVDLVTDRRANLHNDLLARLNPGGASPLSAELYAAAYRPVQRNGQASLDNWVETLAVGRNLTTMPLWLKAGFYVPVDLEATYERTCREQRIMANGA